ncbi:uncharacterized protein KY384_007594 [Bacidia gigantensis]|uniref:uncharacterized protein n=1 Tax=Bacidia gigantensis TaxID=2732470 RepID=UPI001D03B767|nr:uncharacterized protein KY384_007594 [Bacidia gigantensis]KAG8527442.1 hypothetical protein KY384_007594 [Bacidia gigantensis]
MSANAWIVNNRGLDHKCGTCATVLSSPRAKRTCLSVHEEPCSRFHKTLFFRRQSHACESCRITEKVHQNRHKDIFKLTQQLKELDTLENNGTIQKERKTPGRQSESFIPKTEKEPLDIQSWKDGSKEFQAQRRLEIVTTADVQLVADILHPTIEPKRWQGIELRGDAKIASGIANQQDKKRSSLGDIIAGFGVTPTPSKNTKQRKRLIDKLNIAVAADLTAFENEQAETMARRAGYWRYVNKRSYNEMVRRNEIWDWASGEKLSEIDESELGDSVDDGDDGLGTTVRATTKVSDDLFSSNLTMATNDSERDTGSGHPRSSTAREALLGSHSCGIERDDRVMETKIRAASPPVKIPDPTPTKAYHRDKTIAREFCQTSPMPAETPENAFSPLKREVPAPRDEVDGPNSCCPDDSEKQKHPEHWPSLGRKEEAAKDEVKIAVKKLKILNVTGTLLEKPKQAKRFVKPKSSSPATQGKFLKVTTSLKSLTNTDEAWTDVVSRKRKQK